MFRDCFIRSIPKLLLMWQLRNIADYDMDVSPATVSGVVQQAERWAREIIALLDAHEERIEREKAEVETESDTPLA